MRQIYDAAMAKQADRETSLKHHIPPLVLMERAALSMAEYVQEHWSRDHYILLLAGAGNNGGDALALARILYLRGYRVDYILLAQERALSESARIQLDSLRSYGLESIEWKDAILERADLIVDGILGIGLSRPVEGFFAHCIAAIKRSRVPVLAVDIPSGLSADTGLPMGIAIRAQVTFCFQFMKLGHLLGKARDYCGIRKVPDIGISPIPSCPCDRQRLVLEAEDATKLLPRRDAAGNKGSFGKLLVIAGSEKICGAALLSAKAALAVGAGMVRIFTHERNRAPIAAAFPEALIDSYENHLGDEGSASRLEEGLQAALSWANAVLLGPGLGTSSLAKKIFLYIWQKSQLPLILDADGLNLLARQEYLLKDRSEQMAATGEASLRQLILTPHMAEASRLLGISLETLQANCVKRAETYARNYGLCFVLKDATTICALPKERTYLNPTGNSGLATAGSGDVLAGMIAGLTVSGLAPEHASSLGVYLHGLCADELAKEKSIAGIIASDLIEALPRVMWNLEESLFKISE